MPIFCSSKNSSTTSGSCQSRGFTTSVGGRPSSLPQAKVWMPARTSAGPPRHSRKAWRTSTAGELFWKASLKL